MALSDRKDIHTRSEEAIKANTKPEEKQPRDHAVKCRRCLRAMTWNHDAVCDGCKHED